MQHWIARLDIPSGNITPIRRVETAEMVYDFIRDTHHRQDVINKENSKLKALKEAIDFNIPKYDKDVHGKLGDYIKLKIKLKQKAKEELSEVDKEIYHRQYIPNVVQKNTKFVYMAIHEL